MKQDLNPQCDAPNEQKQSESFLSNFKYLLVGTIFGIVFVKAEIISWFRIQEMFRLQSFHMYGVIGSAIAVGIISIFLIKKFNVKTIDGEPIRLDEKKFNKGFLQGCKFFWSLPCTRTAYCFQTCGRPVFKKNTRCLIWRVCKILTAYIL